MRAPSPTSYVWLFLTSLNMVLLLHNVTAAAGRTGEASSSRATPSRKRPRPGTSTDTPAAGGTVIPSSGTAEHSSHSKDPNDEGNHPGYEPECRNVSIGYHILFNSAHEPANEPETSGVRLIPVSSTLALASKEPCLSPCDRRIARFVCELSAAALKRKKRPPKCWASYKFSIVRRRARSVGCDTSLTPDCPMTSLCECTFNLMVPEQMNATKQEMEIEKKSAAASTKSICDMQYFPATISHDLDNIGQDPRKLFTEQKDIADVGERSWPLLGWRSMPGEAVELKGPFPCPEPPERKLPPWGIRAGRKNRVLKEICLCLNDRANALGLNPQCSHRELVCETISLTQVIDKLRRDGGELFDVYVEKFPQLKEYVETISSTAIATDQVSQQNWETLLAGVDSIAQKGLDIDLNEPAADDGDEL